MAVTAADGGQGQLGGVVERQTMAGLDDRVPHGFREGGVLERLQYRVLRGLEGAQHRKRQDVVTVGLPWHNTAQVGVCRLPYGLVERGGRSHGVVSLSLLKYSLARPRVGYVQQV